MYYFKPWSNAVYSKAQYYVTAFFIFYLLDLRYIWFFINLVVYHPCFLNKNMWQSLFRCTNLLYNLDIL